ncbi:YncE family protein [Gemmata sp.]|uniref:YncE family protein n=1 Tax=Gemmata sp. TaxID=1914242 RepID=UPI003F6F0878
MFAPRRARSALVLLTVLGVAAPGGCQRAARVITGGPQEKPCLFSGTDVAITFPGEPLVDDGLDILAQEGWGPAPPPVLRYDDPGTGLSYAARAATVDESSFHFHSDAELAAGAVEPAVKRVAAGRPGPATPAVSNGYRSVQVVVPTDTGRVYVIRGVACGPSVVVAAVSGPGLDPADGRVVRFFDSISGPEARTPGWKPVTPPSGGDFRPHAWILPVFGAGFAPSRSAVYLREVTPGGDWNPGWKADPNHAVAHLHGLANFAKYDDGPIFRYHYPSFRREAQVKVERSHGCVVNDAANQLYVLRYAGFGRYEPNPHFLLVYDLGPPHAPHPDPVLVKEVPAPRFCTPPLVSPDGRHAYWLAWGRESGRAIAVRLDAKTLEVKELPLNNHYRKLCLSPGGRSLVVAPYFEVGAWNKGLVGAELDPETWQVRRVFKLAKSPHSMVVTDDSRVIYVTWSSTHHDTGRVAVLNLNDPEPAERYLDRPPAQAGLTLSPDGRRLYLSGSVWPNQWGFAGPGLGKDPRALVWDAVEAANGRVRELGHLRSSTAERVVIGDVVYPSPDGKCLLFHSGRAYWLGDGPVPEVDPAARWKP